MSAPVGRSVRACSFCGKDQTAVARLIGGPRSIAICNECIALCGEILQEETQGTAQPLTGAAYCVICGKAQAAVAHLVSGVSGVGICGDCIDTYHDIVHRQPQAPKEPAP